MRRSGWLFAKSRPVLCGPPGRWRIITGSALSATFLGTAMETTSANKWTYQGDWSSSRIWMLGWNAGLPGATGQGGEDPYLDGATASYIFRHGDYDYVNGSIADWTSGYSHTLPNSFYLSSQPSFFGASGTHCTYPWPWVTPTGSSPIQSPSGSGCTSTDALPAKARCDRWDAVRAALSRGGATGRRFLRRLPSTATHLSGGSTGELAWPRGSVFGGGSRSATICSA